MKLKATAPLLCLLSLIFVVGCNGSKTDETGQIAVEDLPVVAEMSQSAPEPRKGFDWKLWIDEMDAEGNRRVFLFYAQKNDDVDAAQLRFLCLAAEGEVYAAVHVLDESNEYNELGFSSQNENLTLKASSSYGLVSSEPFKSNSTFMQDFAKHGWLQLNVTQNMEGISDGFMVQMAFSTPEGMRAIADFVNNCNPRGVK